MAWTPVRSVQCSAPSGIPASPSVPLLALRRPKRATEASPLTEPKSGRPWASPVMRLGQGPFFVLELTCIHSLVRLPRASTRTASKAHTSTEGDAESSTVVPAAGSRYGIWPSSIKLHAEQKPQKSIQSHPPLVSVVVWCVCVHPSTAPAPYH